MRYSIKNLPVQVIHLVVTPIVKYLQVRAEQTYLVKCLIVVARMIVSVMQMTEML